VHSTQLFLAKADEGTVQYAFDHANNFTLLSVAPKKNKRVVFLFTTHSEKKREEDTGKEEINVFYNQENGGVDSHDQMCSLCTTARKTNRWPMRLFYGIIDSAAFNAFVIFTENVPNFGERKKEKRQKFLKELALALIIPHARQRFEVQQTPQDVKQVIRSCAFYRHLHQLQAPSSVIQHSARDAAFVPDQRTRKPNSSLISSITLCAKSTAKGCATNARSKSWTYR